MDRSRVAERGDFLPGAGQVRRSGPARLQVLTDRGLSSLRLSPASQGLQGATGDQRPLVDRSGSRSPDGLRFDAASPDLLDSPGLAVHRSAGGDTCRETLAPTPRLAHPDRRVLGQRARWHRDGSAGGGGLRGQRACPGSAEAGRSAPACDRRDGCRGCSIEPLRAGVHGVSDQVVGAGSHRDPGVAASARGGGSTRGTSGERLFAGSLSPCLWPEPHRLFAFASRVWQAESAPIACLPLRRHCCWACGS